MDNSVRDPSGQALVNDAPAGHRPSGFDPSRERGDDPAADDSFIGLQARQRELFSAVIAERDRLREYISTLSINASRSTPATRGALVSFIAMASRDVISGSTISDAYKAWDAYQKCSACGAAAGALGNGICFECTPEGQWPCAAQGGAA